MITSSTKGNMPTAARRDDKPTQVNEHRRSAESRKNEHEPHAMAMQRRAQRASRHAQ